MEFHLAKHFIRNSILQKVFVRISFKAICLLLILGIASCFSVVFAIEFPQSFLDEIGKTYGEYAKRRLISWEKMTKESKELDERGKLEAVNRFFNMMRFESDLVHWGKDDYWATPLEFVVSGAGDCEDFSIAKYFSLLELGIADEKLLIMYVKALEYNQAHMVLLYYPTPDGIPLVLDNINKEIFPADKRTDLKPIYGFNGTGLWQAKQLGKGEKIGDANDLKRWKDLGERMKSGKISKWIGDE
jgi:predicted transglutaminase-like cysteine proteinase